MHLDTRSVPFFLHLRTSSHRKLFWMNQKRSRIFWYSHISTWRIETLDWKEKYLFVSSFLVTFTCRKVKLRQHLVEKRGYLLVGPKSKKGQTIWSVFLYIWAFFSVQWLIHSRSKGIFRPMNRWPRRPNSQK